MSPLYWFCALYISMMRLTSRAQPKKIDERSWMLVYTD
jgi:hypothetical protein